MVPLLLKRLSPNIIGQGAAQGDRRCPESVRAVAIVTGITYARSLAASRARRHGAMTNRKPSDDLSKEQILESIGRIVSEGESRGRSADAGAATLAPPSPPPAPKPSGGDEVLDLVDVVDEQGNVIQRGQAAEAAPAFSFPPRPTAEGDRTTDEQMLEALRPMLQTWLDTHMPPIVERLVQRELERAARRSEPE